MGSKDSVDVTMESESESSSDKEFSITDSPSELFYELNNFRKDKQFCDIILKVNTVEYHAHKNVLAAFSPVFKAMFLGEFTEASQSTIELNCVEPKSMAILLDCAYSNSVTVAGSNVSTILHAASYFQVDRLLKACFDHLERNITYDNCLSVGALAGVYCNTHLQSKAQDFAIVNFSTVRRSYEFHELEQKSLINLISHDSLNVKSEDTVFVAVMRWASFQENQRVPILHEVLCHVRLAFVDPVVLTGWVDSLNLRSNPSIMSLIDESYKYQLVPGRRADVPSKIRKFRNSSLQCEFMVIHNEEEGHKELAFMDINGHVRVGLKYPPVKECSSNIIVSGSNKALWACTMTEMWQYSFLRCEWSKITAMSTLPPRQAFGLCELDGFWYAIGGNNCGRGQVTDIVERYYPSKRSWRLRADLPIAVMHPAVVCAGGFIYVLGGARANCVGCDKVQRYDPRKNSWTFDLTSMPVASTNPAAAVLDGKIYVFIHYTHKGKEDGRVVYVYDVLSNSWENLASLPNNFRMGPVIANGNIFVIVDSSAGIAELLRYEQSTNSWVNILNFKDFYPLSFGGPFLSTRFREVE